MGSILFIGLCVSSLMFGLINLWLYFLNFKIEKHPVLIKLLDNALNAICLEEQIKVFNKTYEEINKDETDDSHAALGQYIYTLDAEHQKNIDNALLDIENLEHKYGMLYPDICKLADVECKASKEIYTLPRILLCEKLYKYGMNQYYCTYLHELGHHFAVKELGCEHTEKDADRYALKLVRERLPIYFQLLFWFKFDIDLDFKNTLIAYREYLRYYIKNKKSIEKL